MLDRLRSCAYGNSRFRASRKRFPKAQLIGVEIDPLPAMLARANLAVLRLADRASVTVTDYRKLELPRVHGKTFFVGNPPYVRHHRLESQWKQ